MARKSRSLLTGRFPTKPAAPRTAQRKPTLHIPGLTDLRVPETRIIVRKTDSAGVPRVQVEKDASQAKTA
jgi:hypothetical protein